jgi:cysteine desulfurase family protein
MSARLKPASKDCSKVSDSGEILYFDNAATSWPKPPGVMEAMMNLVASGCANPGRSGHRLSIATARSVYEARENLSELLGIEDSLDIVFTLNATMALNLALFGLLQPGDHVITTSMEHNSVMRPLRALVSRGVQLTVLPCHADGSFDPGLIASAMRSSTKLFVMTHASNVTGTLMPVQEAGRICRELGLRFMVDAAQTVGAVPLAVRQLDVDLLAFTGHKGLYGPQGTGGLYVKKELQQLMKPLVLGGTGSLSEQESQPDFMPDRFESGTPNSPGLAGLAAAAAFIQSRGIASIAAHERRLTEILLQGLLEIERVTVYGPKDGSGRTAVVSMNIQGASPSEVAQLLDEEYGILVRPGLHCAPSAHRTVGTFPQGAVRFSMGLFHTEEQVATVIRAVAALARKFRKN